MTNLMENHRLELIEHVSAPPEAVWKVLTDVSGAQTTLQSVSRVQLLTQGGYDVGTRWRKTRKMMGREETQEMSVSEADQNRSTTVKSLSGGAEYTTVFTLVPDAAGTVLTMNFGMEILKPTVLSAIMMALFGKLGLRFTRRMMQQDLKDIAAKAETVPAG